MKLFSFWLGLLAMLIAGPHRTVAQSNDFEIKVGTESQVSLKSYDARNFAGNYVPYAIHAWHAYSGFDQKTQEPAWPFDGRAQPESEKTTKLSAARAQIKTGWHFLWGHSGPLHCLDPTRCKLQGIPISGLEIQVWRRTKTCEFVISFRGTDFSSFEDWVSNFRWITRIVPVVSDEYDQVRKNIRAIVDVAKKSKNAGHCRDPKLIAVGHSLGGGLAQHAAYAHGKIKRVYAFDPTPVTAAVDISWDTWKESTPELEIDRVYQRGEVLEGVRRFTQNLFFPPSKCDPLVRTVTFNAFSGNFIQLHSIDELMLGLIKIDSNRALRTLLPPPGNKNCASIELAKIRDAKVAKAAAHQKAAARKGGAQTPHYVAGTLNPARESNF